ncbi:cellulose biosynthesis protein BcsP [Undibacterium curvum]|uniref:Cellulose biosynthesis protein BcsR n=1 Tax=Undibacterium curvum TaxID=2762294 RepID=A0ABR7A4G9_9BURK|nr:cellulose biosynthesis protein BcsP [Undibacterium curvum]MBC3931802.1 hypothetical protein [Undibacterium curvum]
MMKTVNIMDDDIKNLFQKFGQPASGYREINRDVDSEQARQRWPLLRDVRVHAASYAEDDADEATEFSLSALTQQNQDASPYLNVAVPDSRALPAQAGQLFRFDQSAPSVQPETQPETQVRQAAAANAPPVQRVQSLFSGVAAAPEIVPGVGQNKQRSVSAILDRLAKKPEQSKSIETPNQSFFKKIFRS